MTDTSTAGSIPSQEPTNSTVETNHDLSVNLTTEEALQHPREGDLSIQTQQNSNNNTMEEMDLDLAVSWKNTSSTEIDSNTTSTANEGIGDRLQTSNSSTTGSTTNTTAAVAVDDALIVATQTTVQDQEETSSNNDTRATGNTNEDTGGAPGEAAVDVQDPVDNSTLVEASRNTTDPAAVMAPTEPSAVNVTLSEIKKS
jgi:hypothetical protein